MQVKKNIKNPEIPLTKKQLQPMSMFIIFEFISTLSSF